MADGDAREGKWRGNWPMQWVTSTLHTTSEHDVSSITTADAHTSAASSRMNWRPPADLNGLVPFAARRNLVSARVLSHFNWPLPSIRPRQTCCVSVYWSPVFVLAVEARIQLQITLCGTFVGQNGSGTRSAGTSVFHCHYHSTYAIQGVFKMLLRTSRVISSNPNRRKGSFKHRPLSGS